MSIDNALRVTVRVDVPELSHVPMQVVDIALPASSSLAEVFEDLLQLVDAPHISRPWQGLTATGTVIDPHVPFEETALHQGGILILTPHRETTAPVVRDAAESLAELDIASRSEGLSATVFLVGVLGFVALIARYPLPNLTQNTLIFLLLLLVLAVLVWHRYLRTLNLSDDISSAALALVATTMAFAGTTLTIGGHFGNSPTDDNGWALVGSTIASGIVVMSIHAIARPPLAVTATLSTVFALIFIGSAAMFFVSSWVAVFAVIVAACLLLVAFAPGISVMWSGLEVPFLPSAGQELKVADDTIRDFDAPAQNAHLFLSGIVVGCGIVGGLSTLGIATNADGFALALTIAVSGAIFLHAIRHRGPAATWGLWFWGMCSIASSVACVLITPLSPLAFLLVAGLLLASISAPLWAVQIRKLRAGAVSWLEKLEILAISATVPLCAHHAGLFVAIRGLG